MKLCKCGCGGVVSSEGALYLPGHYWKTSEMREKQRLRMRRLNPMSNSLLRLKVGLALKGRQHPPEFGQRISQAKKGKPNPKARGPKPPEFGKRVSEGRRRGRGVGQSPSQKQLEGWKTGGEKRRGKHRPNPKISGDNHWTHHPEKFANSIERLKERNRANASKATRDFWNKPEYEEKRQLRNRHISESFPKGDEHWARRDPEFHRKWQKKTMAGPNAGESKLLVLVNSLGCGVWRFNRVERVINGMIPDLITNESSKLIEYSGSGDYFERVLGRTREYETTRPQAYHRFGIDCCVVWDTELYARNQRPVINKLYSFLSDGGGWEEIDASLY